MNPDRRAPATDRLIVASTSQRGTFEVTVDIAIEPGELVLLAGPNGSGKTSLLHTVAGLIAPTSGRVTLGDAVLDDADQGLHVPPEHRTTALVHQQHLLFPHLSALENAAFGLRARGVPKQEARARGGEWLGRLGLADCAALRADRLSGGQSQRVALARALATSPRALLLDEPLAALDVAVRGSVRDMIISLVREWGVPAILVSHDPAEAEVADRVIQLEGGRVVGGSQSRPTSS